MIKAMLTIFLMSSTAYASVTVHCENDFDCESSSNVKSIHATSLLWRFPSFQEPKYDLENLKEKGGKIDISQDLLPATLTFLVEYYYGDDGRHTLLHKVLNITHDGKGYHYELHTKYYDHSKDLHEHRLTQKWIRTTAPKELFMKIINNQDAQDGIDMSVDDGILIEIPQDEKVRKEGNGN
jgi:hypothetical protein